MSEDPRRLLLTFRLDPEQRQRLRARLARDGKTMSEVVTHGLRQFVQQPRLIQQSRQLAVPERPALPDEVAARLRELRSAGRSGVLSATLAALHEAGWPLPALASALGVSRQAIQVRVRQKVPAEFRDRGVDYAPPPPFPRRREASKGRLRPHVTIKIDQALRAAAHRAAAHEGSSLSQVVETILDRYLRHGLPDSDSPD
jgi:antitoxin component of RelBE/YafQ-DinJ toxin-antitoxin module